MFQNDNRIDYARKLVSSILNVDYDFLKKNMFFHKNINNGEKVTDKSYISDFVVKVGNTLIDIEMNNYNCAPKNIDYAFDLSGGETVKGGDYIYRPVIVININNFYYEGQEDIIDIFYMCNKKGLMYTEKQIFVEVYLPLLNKKLYDKGIKSFTESEKIILAMFTDNVKLATDLSEGNELLEKYTAQIKLAQEDKSVRRAYDKALYEKNEMRKEMEKDVYESGQNDTWLMVISKMLNDGDNVKKIQEFTGLSYEKIEEIIKIIKSKEE